MLPVEKRHRRPPAGCYFVARPGGAALSPSGFVADDHAIADQIHSSATTSNSPTRYWIMSASRNNPKLIRRFMNQLEKCRRAEARPEEGSQRRTNSLLYSQRDSVKLLLGNLFHLICSDIA